VYSEKQVLRSSVGSPYFRAMAALVGPISGRI
jgi:hypothetical protein